MFCSYPSHEVTSKEKIKKQRTDMEGVEKEKHMSPLLSGNDYQLYNYFQTVKNLKNSHNISVISENTDMSHD